MWKNTEQAYGRLAKTLHWLSALTVLGLFALGYWMVDLTYYSPWYKTAPHWHKSIGLILLFITTFRLTWRFYNPPPKQLSSLSVREKKTSAVAHIAIYALLFMVMSSGYLISTADDRAIEVFNWFSVPAFGELFANQADIAGLAHKYIVYGLMILSVLHSAAALKHHFIDKDATLKRMLR